MTLTEAVVRGLVVLHVDYLPEDNYDWGSATVKDSFGNTFKVFTHPDLFLEGGLDCIVAD